MKVQLKDRIAECIPVKKNHKTWRVMLSNGKEISKRNKYIEEEVYLERRSYGSNG